MKISTALAFAIISAATNNVDVATAQRAPKSTLVKRGRLHAANTVPEDGNDAGLRKLQDVSMSFPSIESIEVDADFIEIVDSLNDVGIQVDMDEAIAAMSEAAHTQGDECRALFYHLLQHDIKAIDHLVDKICGKAPTTTTTTAAATTTTTAAATTTTTATTDDGHFTTKCRGLFYHLLQHYDLQAIDHLVDKICGKEMRKHNDKARNRLLEDASYNPTPEEAFQVAKETNGDLDAGYVLQENLLTPEECALLVAFTDENEGVPMKPNTANNDHVVIIRKNDPLEGIIGVERAQQLYKFFKDNSNGAPVTQLWFRRLTGESGLAMSLHTDVQPYQLKITLNDDFEDGDTLVVDRSGAKSFHLETGAGYIHDKGLVHGYMPHSGDKYILYLISDPNTRMKDLAAETLALKV